MTVHEFITSATESLKMANVSTARLDAQVLAAHVLERNKTWLLAHPDHELTDDQSLLLADLLARRLQREPIAYLVGKQEFYGRDFTVTPAVLVPRPETEALINMLLKTQHKGEGRMLDVGTGSGAIAITAKLEMPALKVHAVDLSPDALAVALHNAHALGADITLSRSDLLTHAPQGPYNYIVANLPYVDTNWDRSPETTHEPSLALFANDDGLELIKKLITQTPDYLAPDGCLLLEADPRQHSAIIDFTKDYKLTHAETDGFGILFQGS